jgi:hypothetical protein
MSIRPSTVTVLVAALALLAFATWRPGVASPYMPDTKEVRAASPVPDAKPTPVIVELFTSEGCSSCPPADALLSRLGRTQPVSGADIIILEEHVDYWDRLGWKDPFSSEEATARQNEYDMSFAGFEVYTPQMVVDGRAKFVGNSDSDALRAIRTASQAPKPVVHLSWNKDDTLEIHVDPLNNTAERDGQQVFMVVAENMLRSDVKHGENAGRALEHNGVVRQLLPLAKIDVTPAEFSSSVAVHSAREWNRANLRAVVFVQERRSRHILAAAAIPFPTT